MTFAELKKTLQQKKYAPLYLLHGEEPYFIDTLTAYFENNVLSESEKAFNYTVLYGKDADARSLIDTASRYPMMAPYQLVLLKEAQDMRTLRELQVYCKKPVSTTILVVCHKHRRLDMRTSFGKTLKDKAVVFESKRVYDNQIGSWIENYLHERKFSIEPEATILVAEYLGTNLSSVANELDKLALNVPAGTTITPQVIQDHIGISKDYNVFELQDAISNRNTFKAQQIVSYFIANPKRNPLVVVIATLYGFFSKVYISQRLRNLSDYELAKKLRLSVKNQYAARYKVAVYRTAVRHFTLAQTERAIAILKETDIRSKGVGNSSTPHSALLKEMVSKIMQ